MMIYLKQGLLSRGGEWLCGGGLCVFAIRPRTPGLIWVRDLLVGDVMVDGLVRVGRLRPLGLSWVAARGREPSSLGEQAAMV